MAKQEIIHFFEYFIHEISGVFPRRSKVKSDIEGDLGHIIFDNLVKMILLPDQSTVDIWEKKVIDGLLDIGNDPVGKDNKKLFRVEYMELLYQYRDKDQDYWGYFDHSIDKIQELLCINTKVNYKNIYYTLEKFYIDYSFLAIKRKEGIRCRDIKNLLIKHNIIGEK